MTKLTQLLAGLLLFSAAFLTACGGDDDADPCGTNFNYTLDLQDEADALSAAASTYAANPTTANCNPIWYASTTTCRARMAWQFLPRSMQNHPRSM